MIDQGYKQELARIQRELSEKRIALSLPEITPAQRRSLLAAELMPSCIRLVEYLFKHQGSRTDTLSQHCAVANVPDVFMKSRHTLSKLGLNIACDVVKSINRYDTKTVIGTWWLVIEDYKKWQKAEHHSIKLLANF
jgi:hypothetical protein